MRARLRMAQERADLIRRFGREDVLELAGLLLDFGLAVHGERIGEEALGETMAADDVGSAVTATAGEFYDQRALAGGNAAGFERIVAGVHEGLVSVGLCGMRMSRY